MKLSGVFNAFSGAASRRYYGVSLAAGALLSISLVGASVVPAHAADQASQSESATQLPGAPVDSSTHVESGSKLSDGQQVAPGSLLDKASPTGDPDEPAPTALDPDAESGGTGVARGSEITSKSTYENVWSNPDGTKTAQMSLTPINVKDSSGDWVDVNTTVSKTSDGDFTVKNNPVSPTFASSTSDSGPDYSVTSTTTHDKVSFTLEGEHDADAHTPTAAQVDASDGADAKASQGVAYDDVLKNADLSYQVDEAGVKEALILDQAPTAASPTYTWDVHAPGLTLSDGPLGAVLFKDDGGKTVFYTPTPLMTDSSGVPGQSGNAVQTIPLAIAHVSGSDWKLTLTPDAAWLQDPARVYPVSLDPTMQNGSPNMAAYESSNGSNLLATASYANIGNSQAASPYSMWRSVGSFPYNQTFGKTILAAQLLEQENNSGTASATNTQAGWASSYSYNCGSTRITGSNFSAGYTGTATIDVTSLVSYWVSQRSDGGSFCLQGQEDANAYTYKQINTALWIQYEDTPQVNGYPTTIHDPNPGFPDQQTSPGATTGGPATSSPPTSSTTPTLNINASQDSSNNQPLSYQFFVSTNSNPYSQILWNTPWQTMSAGSRPSGVTATVPVGKLAPGTKYYWDAVVQDQYGIQAWSPVYAFTTSTLPGMQTGGVYTPGNNSVIASTSPTLTAPTEESTNGQTLQYEVRLTSGSDGTSGQIAQSPLCAASGSSCTVAADGKSVSWQVPAGILQDGASYTWLVVANDGYGDYVYSADGLNGLNRVTVNSRVSDAGPAPTDTAGPVGVNLANGNVSASFTSPTVKTVGGDMGMNFAYNSRLASNQGLTGTYYNEGASPTFTYATPGGTQALVRTDSSIQFDWGNAAPDDAVSQSNFQVQWTGYITPPAGTYAFGFLADDGVELKLGTQDIITDQWKDQHQLTPQIETGSNQILTVTGSSWSIGSQSGTLPVPITVNYYQRTGSSNVYLEAEQQTNSKWGASSFVPATWYSKTPQLLPSGWASSAAIMGDAGQYVSASKQGGSVIVTDTDGGTHTYARTSTSGYTPPPGEQSVLATDQNGNLVLTDESGTVYQFNAAGLVTSVVPSVDVGSKPATPIPNYNAARQLTSLSDPLSASGSGSSTTYGRQVQFSYLSDTTIASSATASTKDANGNANRAPGACAPSSNTNSTFGKVTAQGTTTGADGQTYGSTSDAGMLCQIVYPDGTTSQLYYNVNGQLAQIVDPGGEVTDFAYTLSSGTYLLTSIWNSLATDWIAANPTTRSLSATDSTTIGYDSQNRATSVTLAAPDGQTTSQQPKKTYTYAAQSTPTSDGTTDVDVDGLTVPTTGGSNGHANTVTYNNSLQATSTRTASGLTSTSVWNDHDNPLESIDPQGHESSTVYDQEDRATASYGPAPTSCFGSVQPATSLQRANGPLPASSTCAPTGMPVATTSTSYDGSMPGLAATWFNNTNLAGAPSAYSLGIPSAAGGTGGSTDGSINYDWSTSSAAVSPITGPSGTVVGGTSGANWTSSFTGLVTFPKAGTYTFYTMADDGTQLWINDQLVVNNWGPHGPHIAPGTKSFTVAAGQTARIRLNYEQLTGGARLQLAWTTGSVPASYTAGDTVPASVLSPAYNLQTSATSSDSTASTATASQVTTTKTTSAYTNPWYGGTAASTTIDPAGLNLTTSATTESANGTGYLRQLSSTKPAGSATTSTNVYYGGAGGDSGAVANNCGVPTGASQFGMLESSTGPQAADGSRQVTTSVYDVFGRIVGTKSSGDSTWSCTTYDARGRVISASVPAFEGNAARVVTNIYTADGTATGDPLTTSTKDSVGTITTVTDLLGQVVGYTDVWGTVTSSVYNRLGQLVSKTSTPTASSAFTQNYAYNVDGQITQVSDGQNVLETVTYTNGVITGVSEPTGTGTEGNGVTGAFTYDATGASVGINWTFPNGQNPVTDAVTRSQAGKVLTDTLADGNTSYASSYTYDADDRLTAATVPWNKLTYGFGASGGCGANTSAGADGNRTTFTDSTDGSTTPFTMTYCYDNADRLTSDTIANSPSGADTLASTALTSSGSNPNLAYDAHGNTTTLADQTLTYDGADRLSGINSTGGATPLNATQITYIRDALDRVVSETTTAGGTTTTKRYSYPGNLEGTNFITDDHGNVTDRLANLPAGVTQDTHGPNAVAWSYPNIHGDVIVTADSSGTRNSSVALYDPFGDPIDPITHLIDTFRADKDQPSNLNGTTTAFGWEGSHEKVSDDSGDISSIEMGARQYVPLLGRFLQTDPSPGGNDTDYSYPADPVSMADITGNWATAPGPVSLFGTETEGGAAEGGAAEGGIAAGWMFVPILMTLSLAGDSRVAGKPNPGKNKQKGRYYVYVITSGPRRLGSDSNVWKYGISRTAMGHRPNRQISLCNAHLKFPAMGCQWQNENTFTSYPTKGAARAREYQLINAYVKKHGRCPPGHGGRVCT